MSVFPLNEDILQTILGKGKCQKSYIEILLRKCQVKPILWNPADGCIVLYGQKKVVQVESQWFLNPLPNLPLAAELATKAWYDRGFKNH